MAACFSIISLYGVYLRRCLSRAGLSSQAIEIDDETTMHFWGPNPNSSTNSKPRLLLIHGFGPHGIWQWRPQIEPFAQHFDLYIPDLVFFGESITKSNERSEVFQAICVGKMMEKLGVSEYSVVGTSYGGFVGYRMASMWPQRVQKMVIASSAVNMRKKDLQELSNRANLEKIEDLMLPATPSQLRTLMKLTIHKRPYMPDFLLSDFIEKLYAENRKEKMELLSGLTIGSSDEVNITPLRQEVLIVWGNNDQIFLLEKAHELKEILGKEARLEVIKNASHVPQLELPGQFNNIVMNFLC